MTKDTPATSALFTPIKVGSNTLQHRVFLPPLTRTRADAAHVPTDIMVEYYGQRSARPGTLLVTEGIFPTFAMGGYPGAPGLWSQDHIDGWKKVTDKVHSNQSFIYAQIWVLGRVASPEYLSTQGAQLIAPSPISFPAEGGATPHELTLEEIDEIKKAYATASINALEAGFDGVEIHSANGYLLNQFISRHSNTREDKYGGSIENRARLSLEVVDTILEAIQSHTGSSAQEAADKVGIRFSPWGSFQDMHGRTIPNELATFTYLAAELEQRAQDGKRLAYIHVVEPRGNGDVADPYHPKAANNEWIYLSWQGIVLRAGGYDAQLAYEHAQQKDNTLIGFGRHFISTPDLVDRLEKGLEFTDYDRSTFYNSRMGSAFYKSTMEPSKGYTDYPRHH